ncbi:hypothetical protein A5707_06110 [Mycobacterium kyorinense]|uniref:DUF4439 domain-containing protein n=1 Tax=Mycobacterium kyorinense TaxID=487514 RepID=A0A1A2YW21_9MYCO|nr:ferritin-like domain-containing protein [Mycobacterium kyorinense]OBI42200.1 hypothetical protein A5707_06110 [Mycobacterium kyorinense]
MTSPEPTAYTDALCAALTTEHAVIYGYGIVSARCTPDVNKLVAASMTEHRERRDQVIAMLTDHDVTAPVAAAGYQLPMPVNNENDAARLAARMEKDTEVAWRAVVEQAQAEPDRGFGVKALTQSAVLAARWNRIAGVWPITSAFPGGGD